MMSESPSRAGIDPRGPRFGAGLTAILLAAALVLGPSSGMPVLIVQTLAFAAGAMLGLKYQPWGWFYQTILRRFLAAPDELEDPRPPRFAQVIGLVFAIIGLIGSVTAAAPIFYVAVGFALVAALLNALFDFCLGCEIYVLLNRVASKQTFTRRWTV